MLLRAAALARAGQPAQAAAVHQEAARLSPNLAVAANDFAWWYATRGTAANWIPSLSVLLAERAAEFGPDDANCQNTLGVALYRSGRYREAVAALEKSLAMGKGKADAFDLYFLAMCHARLGADAKAQECFDRAVAWDDRKRGGLAADQAAELVRFRAEAAGRLGVSRNRTAKPTTGDDTDDE
jgi:Tfp pilus assembly protein PilF